MRIVALLQGSYYVLTGVWPLLHLRSFLRVTGPKTDVWLVHTVGSLIALIGATLLAAAVQDRFVPALVVLGAGSCAVLAAVDVVFVLRRTISRIYLLDAVPELGLLACWIGLAIVDNVRYR